MGTAPELTWMVFGGSHLIPIKPPLLKLVIRCDRMAYTGKPAVLRLRTS